VSNLQLSARAGLLKPSPTLGITAKANAMRTQGVDVVSFAAGEPDFNTPASICQSAIDALNQGFTKYTPSAGIPALRDAITAKLNTENGLRTTPAQIVVSCGAKHSVFNTMQVILNPGDEVILIAPYWMTYAEQIILAGGKPVVVHARAEDNFVPDIAQLAAAVTDRTRAILVNSPSNPTGAVLPPALLQQIADLALAKKLWIISDEIYEKLVYGVLQLSIASLSPEVEAQTITINGFSKTFSMTGWRVGYASAPKELAQAMSNFQDQVTSNPTSFAQRGAVTALALPPDDVEAMRVEFAARRDLITGLLADIPRVKVSIPDGAFYAFPDFSAYLGDRFATDNDLAAWLLETAHVACIPGSVFEGAGHLRLSYAASRENIERGVARIKTALSQI